MKTVYNCVITHITGTLVHFAAGRDGTLFSMKTKPMKDFPRTMEIKKDVAFTLTVEETIDYEDELE